MTHARVFLSETSFKVTTFLLVTIPTNYLPTTFDANLSEKMILEIERERQTKTCLPREENKMILPEDTRSQKNGNDSAKF